MAVLSNREKKFLANEKQMRKHFSAYAEQASIVYEYCREFETEQEVFDRFRNIDLKIKNGYVKKPSSRGWTEVRIRNSQQFGMVNINPFSIADNLGFVHGVDYRKVPSGLNYARVRFFNSKQAKLTARTYTPIQNPQKTKNTGLTIKVPLQKSSQEVRFDSLYNVMRYHRTVYHEMGHAMVKRTVRELDGVNAGRLSGLLPKFSDKKQMVCFSGKNPVYGYEVDKKGHIGVFLWRNAAMQYLEEGVVENIAMDCIENEIYFSDNIGRLKGIDKTQFLQKMQESVTYYSAYALVGLWNCVSGNELTRQHFGGESKNSDLIESTEIFKSLFADYIHSVVGNNYVPKTKGIFTTQKMEKIASNYEKCVDFCKKQYTISMLNSEQSNKEIRFFEDRFALATDIENLTANLESYVDMNLREKAEFTDILSKKFAYKAHNNLQKNENKVCESKTVALQTPRELNSEIFGVYVNGEIKTDENIKAKNNDSIKDSQMVR